MFCAFDTGGSKLKLEPSFAAKNAVGLQDLSTKQNQGWRRSFFTILLLKTSLCCWWLLRHLFCLLLCSQGQQHPLLLQMAASVIAAGGQQQLPAACCCCSSSELQLQWQQEQLSACGQSGCWLPAAVCCRHRHASSCQRLQPLEHS